MQVLLSQPADVRLLTRSDTRYTIAGERWNMLLIDRKVYIVVNPGIKTLPSAARAKIQAPDKESKCYTVLARSSLFSFSLCNSNPCNSIFQLHDSEASPSWLTSQVYIHEWNHGKSHPVNLKSWNFSTITTNCAWLLCDSLWKIRFARFTLTLQISQISIVSNVTG